MRSLYKSDPGRRIIERWCRTRIDEWPVRHRRGLITVDRSQAHLTFIGEGTPKVVFVPGTNFNIATCLGVAEVLGDRWSTLVVDMPGQPGLSSGERPRRPLAARPYKQPWYAAVLAQVLKYTGVKDAVVVGNSLGAAIALACESDRIAARVLYSPGGIVPLKTDALLMRRSAAWLMRPSPERTRSLLDLFVAPGHAPEAATVAWMELVARYCRTTLAPAPLAPQQLHRWKGAPVVAAVGEHDRFLPPDRLGPAVEAALGRELHVLHGVGHLAVEERPDDVVPLVEEAIALAAR
ncbi:alpha/beta fold hydrolase [Glycomyces sp. MUSA5-2]|uniref:alpha/beta fold hydrolase n=1 Tax=Glycomyces sp. MUSA5-2 TaxID=2053002 RepID=UPI00300B91CF